MNSLEELLKERRRVEKLANELPSEYVLLAQRIGMTLEEIIRLYPTIANRFIDTLVEHPAERDGLAVLAEVIIDTKKEADAFRESYLNQQQQKKEQQ